MRRCEGAEVRGCDGARVRGAKLRGCEGARGGVACPAVAAGGEGGCGLPRRSREAAECLPRHSREAAKAGPPYRNDSAIAVPWVAAPRSARVQLTAGAAAGEGVYWRHPAGVACLLRRCVKPRTPTQVK